MSLSSFVGVRFGVHCVCHLLCVLAVFLFDLVFRERAAQLDWRTTHADGDSGVAGAMAEQLQRDAQDLLRFKLLKFDLRPQDKDHLLKLGADMVQALLSSGAEHSSSLPANPVPSGQESLTALPQR